jgi:hypothetical protein
MVHCTLHYTLVDHLLWLVHLIPCGDSNLVLPTGFGLDIQQTYRSKLMTSINTLIINAHSSVTVLLRAVYIETWLAHLL